MDNALMGAMIDISDKEWTVGIFTGICAGNLLHFSPIITGEF